MLCVAMASMGMGFDGNRLALLLTQKGTRRRQCTVGADLVRITLGNEHVEQVARVAFGSLDGEF